MNRKGITVGVLLSFCLIAIVAHTYVNRSVDDKRSMSVAPPAELNQLSSPSNKNYDQAIDNAPVMNVENADKVEPDRNNTIAQRANKIINTDVSFSDKALTAIQVPNRATDELLNLPNPTTSMFQGGEHREMQQQLYRSQKPAVEDSVFEETGIAAHDIQAYFNQK